MAPHGLSTPLSLPISLPTGISLAATDSRTRDQLRADWRAVQAATQHRVSRQRTSAASSSWTLWISFCHELGVDPFSLPGDPIPILQVFAQRVRSGTLTTGRRTARSRSVEETLRAVGQTYAGMGSPDPRLNSHGSIDIRLAGLYRSWGRTDPPPSRVKPRPITLLAQVVSLARMVEHSVLSAAEANTLILGYFFLLRPGEYLGCPNPLFGRPLSSSRPHHVGWRSRH